MSKGLNWIGTCKSVKPVSEHSVIKEQSLFLFIFSVGLKTTYSYIPFTQSEVIWDPNFFALESGINGATSGTKIPSGLPRMGQYSCDAVA